MESGVVLFILGGHFRDEMKAITSVAGFCVLHKHNFTGTAKYAVNKNF